MLNVGAKLNNKLKYVYIVKDFKVTGYYKIGFSHIPDHRIHVIERHMPFTFIEIYAVIPSYQAEELESVLHKKFRDKRKRAEWFELDQEDLTFIDGLVLGAKQLAEIELKENTA